VPVSVPIQAAPAPASAPAPATTPAPLTPAAAVEATPVPEPVDAPADRAHSAYPESGSPAPAAPVGPVTLQQVKDSWAEILEAVEKASRKSWLVVFTANVRDLRDDVLTLTFASENDVAAFKQSSPTGDSVSEHLRTAILGVLGLRVKYIARVDPLPATPAASGSSAPASPAPTAAPAAKAVPASGGWAVAQIPQSEEPPEDDSPAEPAWASTGAPAPTPAPQATPPAAPQQSAAPAAPAAPVQQAAAPQRPARPAPAASGPGEKQRYGESVVREILGASFIEEQPHVQRVIPRGE